MAKEKSKPQRFVPLVPVIAFLIVGFLILLIGIILTPIFNDVLHSEFKTMLPMSNKSSTLSTWKDPRSSADMFMKFYFFDLQNPEEVQAGGKPRVHQKGPYTYNEIKIKEDVTFDSKHATATYREPRTLVFNRSMSVGSENDTFTTINVPLVAVVTMLDSIPIGEFILDEAIRHGFIQDEPLFKRLSVYQLIWGYKDALMTDVGGLVKIFNISLPLPVDGYFGFLYKKNDTDDGLYTVNTGQHGLDNYMEVEQWNHNSSLSFWKTKYCNMINGTDGTMYHPFIEKDDKLYLFSSDLGRSIFVVYNATHYVQDIPLYRFKPPMSLFGYPPDNYDNACYCVGSGGCPHNGVLNISVVQSGAPVFASQPHFLNGDYYRQTVDGLNPNESLHNTFIDVEPTVGIVMKGAKRIQMNLAVTPNAFIKEMSKIRSMLFPLLWLDESAEINAQGIATFKQMFFTIEQWITFATYLLIAIGGAIILLTLIYVAVKYRKYRKSQKEENTPLLSGKNHPPATNTPDPEKDWASMMRDD